MLEFFRPQLSLVIRLPLKWILKIVIDFKCDQICNFAFQANEKLNDLYLTN